MNTETLKLLAVQVNGRMMYPELEESLAQYAVDLPKLLEGIRSVSDSFPFELEPAPVFAPAAADKE